MTGQVKLIGEGGVEWTFDLPLTEGVQDRGDRGYLRHVKPENEAPAERPARNAPKAAWVGWAIRVHGLTTDEAEMMTKDDLASLPAEAVSDIPEADDTEAEADDTEE